MTTDDQNDPHIEGLNGVSQRLHGLEFSALRPDDAAEVRGVYERDFLPAAQVKAASAELAQRQLAQQQQQQREQELLEQRRLDHAAHISFGVERFADLDPISQEMITTALEGNETPTLASSRSR